MTANHIHFEVMCALATSGQLTQTELAELREHAETCGACDRRIAELTEVGAHLLLAHAMTYPVGRPPKGMSERFIARAICEGVPLSTRPLTINARVLGCVAAIILGVLSIGVVHKNGLSPDAAHGASTHSPLAIHAENNGLAEAASSKLARSAAQRRDNLSLQGRAGFAGRGRGYRHRSAETTELSLSSVASMNRRFQLNPYPQQNILIQDYSATRDLPDALGPSSAWFRAPLITLRMTSATGKGDSPGLLADCEYCSFSSSSIRPRFASPPSTDKVSHGTLELNIYPSGSKPRFSLDPTAFHLIQGVVP